MPDSSEKYLEQELTGKSIPYVGLVIVISVFSAVVSNVGLEQLVAIAAPVLDIVYPPSLVLIFLSFVPHLSDVSIRFAVVGALGFSALTALSVYGGIALPFLHWLPFDSLGFGWIFPSLLFALLGMLVNRKLVQRRERAALLAQKKRRR